MSKVYENDILLTNKEVLEQYDMTYNSLYHYWRKGMLSPPLQFAASQTIYWRMSELEKLMALPRKRGLRAAFAPKQVFADPQEATRLLGKLTATGPTGQK